MQKSVSTDLQQKAVTPALSMRRVCLGYDGEWVLHNVTLDIPCGAFLPLVGPNGGGKTTLLRGLLGLLPVECGEIKFGDGHVRLGYVPQQRTIDSLYPLPVIDIVMMVFYRDWGWLRPSLRHRRIQALEALEAVGLADVAYKNYRELSGGMKQRALIARALASGSDILVLDEPTSELDAPSERDIIGRLLQLNREQEKTILIACHGLQFSLSLAGQVCLVEHGHANIVDVEEAKRYTSATFLSDAFDGEGNR